MSQINDLRAPKLNKADKFTHSEVRGEAAPRRMSGLSASAVAFKGRHSASKTRVNALMAATSGNGMEAAPAPVPPRHAVLECFHRPWAGENIRLCAVTNEFGKAHGDNSHRALAALAKIAHDRA